jgi:hypothetical protein
LNAGFLGGMEFAKRLMESKRYKNDRRHPNKTSKRVQHEHPPKE